MTTALPPRALLLSLYGAYLRDLGGWAPVADLIALLEDVDVSAQSTRSAISRMKHTGFLAAERREGVAGYALTADAMEVLADGDELIYQSVETADGNWVMVLFSVPEEERAQRHRLRSRLGWLGFGQLGAGVWVAPASAGRRLSPMLRTTGLDHYVTVWAGRPLEPASIETIVADAWDLDALADAYRSFIDAYEPATAAPEDDRTAFAVYLRLLSDWRRLPSMDPGLPDELLPPSWPGAEARALFARRREELEEPGRRHVAVTMGLTTARPSP